MRSDGFSPLLGKGTGVQVDLQLSVALRKGIIGQRIKYFLSERRVYVGKINES